MGQHRKRYRRPQTMVRIEDAIVRRIDAVVPQLHEQALKRGYRVESRTGATNVLLAMALDQVEADAE